MKQELAEKDFYRLEKQIGYQFQNKQLLQQALMHSSMQGHAHNDRLEFLGDALLGYSIAMHIYHHQQHADPGRMTLLRASLINNIVLAEIAEEICLDQFVSSSFEINESNKQTVLADAMEALIAAVYLDGDIDKVNNLIQNLFASRLSDIDHVSNDQLKSPIGVLQERLHSQGLPLPIYEAQQITNTDTSAQDFCVVSCIVTQPKICVVGCGASNKKAKHAAAQSALSILDHHG